MKIRNVKSFKVFDLVHWKGKGVHTLVSLDLDGNRYYSILLDGIRQVSSGENVTVVFRDDKENTVLAWTDQKSQAVLHVGGSNSLAACFVFLFIALLLVKFTGILRMAAPIPRGAFVIILLSTFVLLMGTYMRRRKLESAMRAHADV